MEHFNKDSKMPFYKAGKRWCSLFIGFLLLIPVSAYSESPSNSRAGEKSSLEANQQKKKITGTIADPSGEPIIGATVSVSGTTNGTITDIDGRFSIDAPVGSQLQISFIGYRQMTITADQADMKIILQEDNKLLNEVVVVGYGTQRKGEITSSISSVTSDNFIEGAVQDAGQLLRGKVAGLGIVLPNGDPTATSQLILRGAGTINSETQPLIIIDGVPGDLSFVAAEDIESIDVVKDGSAAAIYGTRGNNGVIFVTTKKVNRNNTTTTIEVQSFATIQTIKKRPNMLSSAQYREFAKQGKTGTVDYGGDTDWLDLILRSPISSVTNVSMRGGNITSNYIANINYRNNQGIIRGTDNKILTTRLEINHSMWDNLLKFNLNVMGREQNYSTLGDGYSFDGNIYRWAILDNPTDTPKDKDGKWIHRTENLSYNNPVAAIEETMGNNKNSEYRVFGSATFMPIESLFIKALVSRSIYNETRGYAETSDHSLAYRAGQKGFASRGTGRNENNMVELTAQYKNTFGKHDLTGLLGYSYIDDTYEFYWMNNYDFPADGLSYNNMGVGNALKEGRADMGSDKSLTKLIGGFARINYNYNLKYLFSASIRREGSTKFGVNHKWGNFPAVSVGWNVKEEDFMKSFTALTNLKLRTGFGVTGTEPTDAYISKKRIQVSDNMLLDPSTNKWGSTMRPKSNANPDLRWERKEEMNFGVDFGFLNDRINGSIDIYNRKTKDLLYTYTVPMPPFLYPEMRANGGSLRNEGLEVHLNIIPVRTKDLQWTSTVNYSTNKNKLESLSNGIFPSDNNFIDRGWTDEPIQQNTHRVYVGGPIGDFYGFKSIDIDADGKWIIEGKDGKPKPIAEQQADDKKVLGNGIPKHFLSWDNTVIYKNFDFNVMMRGAFKYQILNFSRMFLEAPVSIGRGNVLASVYDNVYGKRPLSEEQDMQYVSYYVEKGDFWKIDNITVGYSLLLNKKYLKKVRFYGTATGLYTFTSYKGIDPEVSVLGLDPGNDRLDTYPSTRSFTVGAMFTF